jgi:hypothetical protein
MAVMPAPLCDVEASEPSLLYVDVTAPPWLSTMLVTLPAES